MISEGLIALGFEPGVDFICRDDSDGNGPYIAAWLSERPQPSQSEIDAARDQPEGAGTIEKFRLAIQNHVDLAAASRRYDGGTSLASYVASTNPQWAAEASAFVAWRDAVWTYAYAELDKVLNAEREQPAIEAFIAELPVIEWPVYGKGRHQTLSVGQEPDPEAR